MTKNNSKQPPPDSKITTVRATHLMGPIRSGKRRRGLTLDESSCVVFTGYRGAGKTFSLAYVGGKGLAAGKLVMSNFPIKFLLSTGQGRSKLCETKPLDWDALYALDKNIENALVLITEIQYFAGSRRFMSLNNRLLNSIIQQMRHRGLSFYFDVKDLMQIDTQLRFEVDVEIRCKDAAHTGWGDELNIEKGHYIMWNPIDLSGQISHTNYPKKLPGQRLNVKPLRGIYETKNPIDVLEAMTPLELDLEKRKVGNRNGNGHERELSYMEKKSMTLKILTECPRIKRSDFWRSFGDVSNEQKEEIKTMMPDWGIKETRHDTGDREFVIGE